MSVLRQCSAMDVFFFIVVAPIVCKDLACTSLYTVSFLYSFAVISLGKKEVVALLLSSGCHVTIIVLLPLPRGEVGWSVVCDCGISLSNSLAFVRLLSSNINKILLRIKLYTELLHRRKEQMSMIRRYHNHTPQTINK